ncbi:MAG TPA: hypothetical protein VMV50_01375 [Candidatus Paceibacterota bacterium]|nr:hypothetical protein [Candidatus Paceibacterota bacterium]
MYRTLFAATFVLFLPASAFAAAAPAAPSLLTASSSRGNAYVAGPSVVLTSPVAGDLSAAGGSIIAAGSVAGDELLFGGTVSSRAPVAGDFRAAGGSISVEKPIGGDLIAFGFSVQDAGRAGGNVLIVAANVVMADGAAGPVTIYGNDISLAGDFAGNVTIVSSGSVRLAASTTIQGRLSYEAPEPADIPTSVVVTGGVHYANASYLPSANTSRVLAFLSIAIFLLVRILGALILAGLLAGLFPKLAEAVAERAYAQRLRGLLLTTLLGFSALVVTPVLFIMLLLTFVGIGLAFLLIILYALLALLAVVYAGILVGSIFVRRFEKRENVLWRDGVLGMFALSLIALLPLLGSLIVSLFTSFAAGTLLLLFFHAVFPRDDHPSVL